MNWDINCKPRFLKELANIPDNLRKEIEQFVFEIIPKTDNPFTFHGIEKMKGYRQFYKIRFGEYRMGFKIDKKFHKIEFLRVLHRREIYRHFP